MGNTVSIIIITYNRPKDLLDLLHSLNKQDSLEDLEETIILDNASTVSYDDVKAFAEQHPRLKTTFISVPENLGVARGRNLLMKRAKGNLLLVLDDDVLFTATSDFRQLSNLFEKPFFKQANTAVITPRVIYHDNKQVQKTAFPHKDYESYAAKKQFLASYYIGCAHLMKKEVLDKTGVYPEDFFYGMEEYDLGYRILNEGYSIGYDAEVTLEHKESSLGRQPHHKKLQMQWLNKSKVAWRYLPFVYFITTAVSWSFEYLFKTKGHLGSYFLSWLKIFQIPFSEKRRLLNKKTRSYLKKTEARLWY